MLDKKYGGILWEIILLIDFKNSSVYKLGQVEEQEG